MNSAPAPDILTTLTQSVINQLVGWIVSSITQKLVIRHCILYLYTTTLFHTTVMMMMVVKSR